MLKRLNLLLATLLLLPSLFLQAREIQTFYGIIEVDEPILLELIDSPAFQRLKSIHQYGVAYYTTHPEEYTRYDHSIGVFTILRLNDFPLKAQIAGLLHDVSHTIFSHVGDWIFKKAHQEKDYQNSIHLSYLHQSGLATILQKHGFCAEELLPTEDSFPFLENSLPNLSADRIDYNIQGAYHQKFITYEEALILLKDLQYVDGAWRGTNSELLKKLSLFSIFMSQDCWSSPHNYVTSLWLAEAILRAVELGSITYHEIHFGVDEQIWNKLIGHPDAVIQEKMEMVLNAKKYYLIVKDDEADFVVKSRFRGIDPWIQVDNTILRLTSLDPLFKCEFFKADKLFKEGWGIKIIPHFCNVIK